jgi:hypothetical protein
MKAFVTSVSLVTFVFAGAVATHGCAAERVTIEDDTDATFSRPLRDAQTTTDAPVAEKDAAVEDASRADAVADGAPADARPDAPTPTAKIVISEVLEADVLSRRYVELAGPAGSSLADLKLRIVSATGAVLVTVDVARNTTDTMPARGTWVVGGIAGTSVDNGYLVSQWDLPSGSGTVQLVRATGGTVTLVDVVGYGTPAAQVASAPTETRRGQPAPDPAGKALLRRPPSVDTMNNSADFCRGVASPNGANVCDP